MFCVCSKQTCKFNLVCIVRWCMHTCHTYDLSDHLSGPQWVQKDLKGEGHATSVCPPALRKGSRPVAAAPAAPPSSTPVHPSAVIQTLGTSSTGTTRTYLQNFATVPPTQQRSFERVLFFDRRLCVSESCHSARGLRLRVHPKHLFPGLDPRTLVGFFRS